MAALVSLRSGACQPETQTGEFIVTVPVGSATSKIPDRHHALNEPTIELLQSNLWREGIAVVELAERGAYRGYSTLPANSRRSPRGGPRSSMCSRPGSSYHRINYAHQWGPEPGGRLRQGRTRSQGGGNPRWGQGGVRGWGHGVRRR